MAKGKLRKIAKKAKLAKKENTKPKIKQKRKARAGTLITRCTVSDIWQTRGFRLPNKCRKIVVVFSGKLGGRKYELESSKKFGYLHAREAAVEYRNLIRIIWENHPENHERADCLKDLRKHMRHANKILANFDMNEAAILRDIRRKMLKEKVSEEVSEIPDDIRNLDINVGDLRDIYFHEFEQCSLKTSLLELLMVMNPTIHFRSDINLFELCKIWNRNRGRGGRFCERWQIKANQKFTAHQVRQTFNIMARMRMMQKILPNPFQDFSAIVVQGSALFRASERLRFVQSICEQRTVGRIYVLCGDRELDPVLESDAEIERVSNMKPNWNRRGDRTEYNMLKHLWQAGFIPFMEMPVEFIQATTRKNQPRPGTLETIMELLIHLSRTGVIYKLRDAPVLGVSNQPFVRKFFTTLRALMPITIEVQAAGPAAKTEYFKRNVHTFLDSVYNWVKEAEIHDFF